MSVPVCSSTTTVLPLVSYSVSTSPAPSPCERWSWKGTEWRPARTTRSAVYVVTSGYDAFSTGTPVVRSCCCGLYTTDKVILEHYATFLKIHYYIAEGKFGSYKEYVLSMRFPCELQEVRYLKPPNCLWFWEFPNNCW